MTSETNRLLRHIRNLLGVIAGCALLGAVALLFPEIHAWLLGWRWLAGLLVLVAAMGATVAWVFWAMHQPARESA